MASINHIHINRLALAGKIYTEKGIYYVGQLNGSLKVEDYVKGDLKGTTLRTIVANVGDYTTEELMILLAEIKKDISDLEEEEINVEVNSINLIDTEDTAYLLKQLLVEVRINNEYLNIICGDRIIESDIKI